MSIKIGFISPFWLPSHGGVSQYDHRLAHALTARGLEVHAFTATAAVPGCDNGDFPVTRWAPDGSFKIRSWRSYLAGKDSLPDPGIFKLYHFMDAATAWAVSLDLDIVLVGNPLQTLNENLHQARELYLQLKAHGIKVGAIHHDLGRRVETALLTTYRQSHGDWEAAAEIITQKLAHLMRSDDPLRAYHIMGSPLFFSPDFVIACSNWSNRFIDPTGKIPAIVVHPLVDDHYWSQRVDSAEVLDGRDILMINPQGRKGPDQMANLIAGADPGWTFRVLKGGWGDAFRHFVPMVENLPATLENRIDFRDYVQDMRTAYRAAKLVFFPSYVEGYGMTAVEPMFAGTPVVSSNYPAVLEAVGEGAYSLCPRTASKKAWHNAVNEVLNNSTHWREKALSRASELGRRQQQEINHFVGFLKALSAPVQREERQPPV
jgi:glycosyltransferase involved in cell wall biosynthesis